MFDRLNQASQIVLFGGTPWLIAKYLPWLQGAGVEENVFCICDNHAAKCGAVINGWHVHPPKKILENLDLVVFILAGHVAAIQRSIRNTGINNRIVCAPHFRHSFTKPLDGQDALRSREFAQKNSERLNSIYNQNDFYTARALKEILRQRMLDLDAFVQPEAILEFDTQEDYFVDRSLAPLADITFIDCGAYIGDSTIAIRRQFGKRLKKVIAFEPFPNSYSQLRVLLGTSEYGSVECQTINGAVSRLPTNGYMKINLDPAANSVEKDGDGVAIEVCAIDHFDFDVIGDAVLKMDVEGDELEALKGAKAFIEKHKPYMAICVYHKMKDILEIPEYIYSVSRDYTFFLRGGGHTVCYAIPNR